MGCKGSRVQISALRPLKTIAPQLTVSASVSTFRLALPEAVLSVSAPPRRRLAHGTGSDMTTLSGVVMNLWNFTARLQCRNTTRASSGRWSQEQTVSKGAKSVATKFKKKWRATCPKCSRSLSQADFKCSNCTCGHMFVSEIIQRFGTAGKIREVFFGCSVCGQPSPFTACPSPGAMPAHAYLADELVTILIRQPDITHEDGRLEPLEDGAGLCGARRWDRAAIGAELVNKSVGISVHSVASALTEAVQLHSGRAPH